MRTGGTTSIPAEDFDDELERLAASLLVSIGIESGVATLDLLKKDLDRGLTIFADVLRRPGFDPSRVELAKLQAKESIRRRYTNRKGSPRENSPSCCLAAPIPSRERIRSPP